ncbi:hypothetical protein Tco_0452657, partial [Tanacetum coccineum]
MSKPPMKKFFFDFKPDTGVLTAKVVEDIFEHYVLMAKLLLTQPTLCPDIDTLLPFSSENEDKVFNPGILSSPLLSHRGKIISNFSKSPIDRFLEGNHPSWIFQISIHLDRSSRNRCDRAGYKDCPDFKDSRACGFVHRPLDLQSLACLWEFDHNLWDVIVNGDLEEEPAPTGETSAPPAPKTAKQLAVKRNQERVKSILLLVEHDEYLLKFHNVTDAKSLWEAIKSRFGGN